MSNPDATPTPYIVGPPVRMPTDFFGRAEQTRQFFETLAGSQLQSVSVLGLRRAGKTSFLQHVAHPQIMAAHLADARRYAMVYVDLSACATAGEFYGRVYRQLEGFLSKRPPLSSLPPADAYAVESLLYELADHRVVLLMDEFDQLRTADFGQEFMIELRALASVWDYELGYVTASYWDLYRLGNFVGLPLTSPFYNIFHPSPIYLSGLGTADLEDLVRLPASRVGITADDEDVAYVRHIAGSLPFFVQATAAVWLPHKQRDRRPDTGEAVRRLVSEMGPYFEQWWRNFSDVERDVLATVAAEKPVERLPYSEGETAAAVHRLKSYGVLMSTGGQLWIDSLLYKQWLSEYASRNATAKPRVTRSAAPPAPTATPGEEQYERVFQLLMASGRQLEREESLVAPPADGELRNRLAQIALRGRGAVAAESLSNNGASGLRVRSGATDLVTVECALWRGQQALLATVDRALESVPSGCRVAIVLFARRREFALVLAGAAKAMPQHPGFVAALGRTTGERLDFRFRAPGQPSRLIAVSLLLFRLPD